jgi:RTX calcium-binding nonapeptide repeat (4 copies)
VRGTLILLAAVALVALSEVVLSASAGARDRPECLGRTATIVGTSGNDHLQGTGGNDVIVARGGSDVVDHLHHGTDRVCANGGNDTINAKESDKAVVNGGEGYDKCDVERDHGDVAKRCEEVK